MLFDLSDTEVGVPRRAGSRGPPPGAAAPGAEAGQSSSALTPRLAPQVWRPTTFAFIIHAVPHGLLTPRWVTEVPPFDDGDLLDGPTGARSALPGSHGRPHGSHLPATESPGPGPWRPPSGWPGSRGGVEPATAIPRDEWQWPPRPRLVTRAPVR